MIVPLVFRGAIYLSYYEAKLEFYELFVLLLCDLTPRVRTQAQWVYLEFAPPPVFLTYVVNAKEVNLPTR